MDTHKSLALIVLALLPVRIGARYLSKAKLPKPLPGSKLEHLAATVSHYSLYAAMTVMPLTGVTMGYYSGFGLPFFFFPRIQVSAILCVGI
jgi:cytochrome b561